MRRLDVDIDDVRDGLVGRYDTAHGHGVIESVATPKGCWVHFSSLRDAHSLHTGQPVWFICEQAMQDGFETRATHVWTQRENIGFETNAAVHSSDSPAYRSTFTVSSAEPND